MFLTAPATAHAQFATFIPPKPKVPDSTAAVIAAVQKARADSATAQRIANMKTWVDSAAGLPPRPAGRDTVLAPIDTAAPPVLVATARHATTQVTSQPPSQAASPPPPLTHRGTRAPETASDLPFLLVAGSLSVALGVVLLVGVPRVRANA
jgi:hypothetical protein